MQIIGITGTLGAGKGTIVDYLENQKGYNHQYKTDNERLFITDPVRGLPRNVHTRNTECPYNGKDICAAFCCHPYAGGMNNDMNKHRKNQV